ncbi:hypothetical protein [Rhizobium grahamii]|uniref:Uncharacterized protein n=1 Tax=Rhizobium grahamii CCGE 502 TaxID=990285 RepID=S3HC56_9HYPH|nr:hypothetical protein [Rhizobium grahamii]EPE96184.1 hypothetical protein RGCCGE502_21440 [Rhizobium grahamii CCGE 502]
MPFYKETNRFQCSNHAGRPCIVIEQMRTDLLGNTGLDPTKIDYLTEDGDVVSRLDESLFLVLISQEELMLTQR